ncbi:MAG: hypothetical protein ACLFSB_13775 [Chitinispirillaceae bacterium]
MSDENRSHRLVSGAGWIISAALFLFSCASQNPSLTVGQASRFDELTPVYTIRDSSQIVLDFILSGFDRKANSYIRNQFISTLPADSGEPVYPSSILRGMFEALEQHGLNTYTLDPGTFESVYALSQLPVMIGLITIPLHKREFAPMKADRIGSALPTELALEGRNPRLRIVRSIQRDAHGYWIQTTGNMRMHGLSEDRFVGTVVPVGDNAENGKYCQIVSHIVISALTSVDLEGHFEEWYGFMPHTSRKPNIRRSF